MMDDILDTLHDMTLDDIFTGSDHNPADLPTERVSSHPRSLSSPLLTTHLDILDAARGGGCKVASRTPLLASREFWHFVTQIFGRDYLVVSDRITSRVCMGIQTALLAESRAEGFSLALPNALGEKVARFLNVPAETCTLREPSHTARRHMYAARALRRSYDAFCREGAGRPSHYSVARHHGWTFLLHSAGVFFLLGQRGWFGTLNNLLSILSAIETQASAELAVDCLPEWENGVTCENVAWIAAWQRRVVTCYGEGGFAVAKAPEAVSKALCSKIADGNLLVEDGFALVRQKYHQKEFDLGGDGAFTTELCDYVQAQGWTSDACGEAAALIHCCGYPIMDPATSAAKSRRIGARRSDVSIVEVMAAVRLVSHLVAKNYIRIHGRWPPIDFLDPGTTLERLVRDGVITIDDHSYPMEDWDHAMIGKIAEFDPHPDYLSLIQDKACYVGLDLKQDHYDGCLSDRTLRRLVARVLDQSINTEQEIDAFTKDELPDYVYGADLCPKEREFKAEARMFVVLHPVIRRCLSIAQENIKSAIFPYIPYTSMAMSEAEVDAALLTSTTTGRRLWYLELDLSSWNIRFHRFFSEIVGSRLGNMVGRLGLFGQSHRYFERMELAVSVPGLYIPQFESRDTSAARRTTHWSHPNPDGTSNDTLWYDDDSGKEGIEQRFWTCETETMVYLAMFDEPYTFTLMGQGDNQTLVVDFSGLSDEMFKSESERISRKIERTMKLLGHESKPEEFCSSASILTYAKRYYNKGRPVASELKFAQMARVGAAEFENTAEDAFGSIMSGCHGASKNSRYPLSLWVLGLLLTSRFISEAAGGHLWLPLSHQRPFHIINSSPGGVYLALACPAALGGLPTIPWTSFQVSGNPDPLSEAISSLTPFSTMDWVARLKSYLLSDHAYQDTPSLTTLIQAPHSLPFRRKVSPRSVIDAAAIGVMSTCGNVEIAQLARESVESGDSIKEALASIRPVFPTIIADMYAASALGRADAVASRFKASSTITGLVRDGEIINAFNTAAERRVVDIAMTFASIMASPSTVSAFPRLSHIAAKLLRTRWKADIEGLDAAQPWDYPILDTLGDGVLAVRHPTYNKETVGPLKPYVGSRTKEKRSMGTALVKSGVGIADLKRIVLSATAGTVDGNVRALYEEIAKSRCDVDLAALEYLLPQTIGGTPAHRYDAIGSSPIRPVGNRATACWISTNTDAIPGVSASPQDWPFPIQSFIAAAIGILTARTHCPDAGRIVRIALTTTGSELIRDIPRALHIPPPRLRSHPGNALSHIPSLHILAAPSRCGGSDTPMAGSREQVIASMAGLVFSKLVSSRSGAGAMVGGDLAPFDAAVHSAHSSGLIFEAHTRAACCAAIWAALIHGGRAKTRVPFQLALDHSCGMVASMLHPAFDGGWGDISDVVAMGAWVRTAGNSGVTSAIDGLRRHLNHHARSLASTRRTNILALISVPEVWPNAPPCFSLRWKAGAIFWRAMQLSGVPAMGPYRRFLQSVQGKLNIAAVSGVLVDAATLPSIAGVLEDCKYLMDADPSSSQLVLSAIADLATTSGDPATIERQLRRRVAPPPVPSASYPAICIAPILADWATCIIGEGICSRPVLWTLPPGGITRTEVEVVCDRLGRTAGKRSTVAQLWAPVLGDTSQGLVAVVGSGAGGIQAYLAGRGVQSVGLDLASMLPLEHTSRIRQGVPELPGCTIASMSGLMVSTDGNWFGPAGSEFLASHPFTTVVVDIESSSTRYGLELLRPLLEARFNGLVFIKVICSRVEADSMCRTLTGSRGITNVGFCTFSQHVESRPNLIAPGCIRMRLSGSSMVSTDVVATSALTGSFIRVLGCDTSTRRGGMRAATSALTSGLVSASTWAGLISRLQGILDGYKDGQKGAVAGTMGLSAGRAWACIHLFMKIPHGASNMEIAEVLCRPIVPFRDGNLVVTDDKTTRYMRKKLMPRLVEAARR